MDIVHLIHENIELKERIEKLEYRLQQHEIALAITEGRL